MEITVGQFRFGKSGYTQKLWLHTSWVWGRPALRRVNGLGWVQFRFHVTLGDAVTQKKTLLWEKYNYISVKVIASNGYRDLVNRVGI